MSELRPSSSPELPHSFDVPGRIADTSYTNQERGVQSMNDPMQDESLMAPDSLGRLRPVPAPASVRALHYDTGRRTDPRPPAQASFVDTGRRSPVRPPTSELDSYSYQQVQSYVEEQDDLFNDPALDREELAAATQEVLRSIHEIEAAETAIASFTGEEGQVLTDTVDSYLIDHAEKVVAEGSTEAFEEDAVETALIEGALEATRQRQPATENPIFKLEDDGYDEAVTDGIEKLHKKGAILPDGESAAEVVALTVDAYEQKKQEPVSDQLDTAIQYYSHGATKEQVHEATGLDPKILTDHIKNLPDEEREVLQDMRRLRKEAASDRPKHTSSTETEVTNDMLEYAYVEGIPRDSNVTEEALEKWYNALPEDQREWLSSSREVYRMAAELDKKAMETVEANLTNTAPELLEGRLPKDLADRIGDEYAIGLRQRSTYGLEEAEEVLTEFGGVDVANLDLVQSFNVLKLGDDDWTVRGTVIKGYYGSRAGGKFVIAIPLSVGDGNPTETYNLIPDMLRTSLENPEHDAVNPKYMAGYIDGDGVFFRNENFMRSDEPVLVEHSTAKSPDSTTVQSSEEANPYLNQSNEDLAKTVEQFKQRILKMTANGKDTTELRQQLTQVGQVIQNSNNPTHESK